MIKIAKRDNLVVQCKECGRKKRACGETKTQLHYEDTPCTKRGCGGAIIAVSADQTTITEKIKKAAPVIVEKAKPKKKPKDNGKHGGGRPPHFEDTDEEVEAMQATITEYFEQCDTDEVPLTISGLALALDMSTQSLREYAEKDKFSVTIKKAKQIVENDIELGMLHGRTTPAAAIFWLKNNAGWKDRIETESTNTTYMYMDEKDQKA